jgi:hypothetical protein
MQSKQIDRLETLRAISRMERNYQHLAATLQCGIDFSATNS